MLIEIIYPALRRCALHVLLNMLQKIMNELAPPTLQTFWHECMMHLRKGDFYFSIQIFSMVWYDGLTPGVGWGGGWQSLPL